jgi:hypothetical protein
MKAHNVCRGRIRSSAASLPLDYTVVVTLKDATKLRRSFTLDPPVSVSAQAIRPRFVYAESYRDLVTPYHPAALPLPVLHRLYRDGEAVRLEFAAPVESLGSATVYFCTRSGGATSSTYL